MSGYELYEKVVRRLDPEKHHWNWLKPETRDFWERLAKVLR